MLFCIKNITVYTTLFLSFNLINASDGDLDDVEKSRSIALELVTKEVNRIKTYVGDNKESIFEEEKKEYERLRDQISQLKIVDLEKIKKDLNSIYFCYNPTLDFF